MPQDIKTGSVYNTIIPSLSDTADIVVALTNYHYGVSDGIAPEDASVTAGIAGLLKLRAPLASPTFTGNVVLPSTTSIGTITNTELGYLDGVTSSIQTQINDLKTNPQFSGIIYSEQGNPTTIADGSVTLTWSQLKTLIILSTPTTGRTFKLPDSTTNAIPADGLSFDWTIINKASVTHSITISTTGVTGHTFEGKTSIAAATSARFRTRRISSTSYVSYRIS